MFLGFDSGRRWIDECWRWFDEGWSHVNKKLTTDSCEWINESRLRMKNEHVAAIFVGLEFMCFVGEGGGGLAAEGWRGEEGLVVSDLFEREVVVRVSLTCPSFFLFFLIYLIPLINMWLFLLFFKFLKKHMWRLTQLNECHIRVDLVKIDVLQKGLNMRGYFCHFF